MKRLLDSQPARGASSRAAVFALSLLFASCGGSNTAVETTAPAGGSASATAPAIALPPASLSVAEGQPARFTVGASGTGPFTYQWLRDGVPIDGATGAAFSLPAVTLADSGGVFRVVVANAAGNATSENAILTVTPSATPPTLSLTRQPASASVTAGASVAFSVAGTCSRSVFSVQWQRGGSGGAFVDIAGATSADYAFTPSVGDSGVSFRAGVSCSGLSATTSNVATLTVNPAAGMSLQPVAVRAGVAQPRLYLPNGIVREPSGSYAFATGTTIRRLSADLSSITVVAGTEGTTGSVDGIGAAAQILGARSLAVDAAGTLYFVEPDTRVVRRITADGRVTTIAGTAFAAQGFADGAGAAARFVLPIAIAAGPDGNLYVADTGNFSIRKVTPAGVVSTYAGDHGNFGYVDGAVGGARFSVIYGVTVAGDGTVYVADTGNRRIRTISPDGSSVGTLAGGALPASSDVDGIGGAAGFQEVRGMAVDGNTLYVRDLGVIRAVNRTTGAVTTFAGTRGASPTGDTAALIDGPPGTAFLSISDQGITAMGDGRILFTDTLTYSIRVASSSGDVSTIAHEPIGGFTHADGTGVLAQLPVRLVSRSNVTSQPDGSLILTDQNVMRRLAADGSLTPIVGMPHVDFNLDGTGSIAQLRSADQAQATAPDGTVHVADSYDIRKLNPATRTLTTLAGSKASAGAADGSGDAARFNNVQGLAVDAAGNVFASDYFNSAIRRIDPAGNVSTFAGSLGVSGTADGAGPAARFTNPASLAFAPDGTLWVVDEAQPYAVLRRIATDGSVATVATTGAFLNRGSTRLVIDPAGHIYLSLFEGLYQLAPDTGTLTQLIPSNTTGLVFGSSPSLFGSSSSVTVVGVKQLVLINDSQLVRATLP